MKIEHEKNGEVYRLQVSGNLDTGTAEQAQNDLDEFLRQKPKKVLVDLAALDYVASSGLRVFLVFAKNLSREGSRCVYCGMNESVSKVFRVSGISRILKVKETVAEGVDELNA